MSGQTNTSANVAPSAATVDAGVIKPAADLLRSIAKSIEPAFPDAADLLRGQAIGLAEIYRRGGADALREAADRIEAEANAISGTGHLRAWWVLTRVRERAQRLGSVR